MIVKSKWDCLSQLSQNGINIMCTSRNGGIIKVVIVTCLSVDVEIPSICLIAPTE